MERARVLYVGEQSTAASLAAKDGLTVEAATTASDARSQLQETLDCVVVEYALPDSDGIAFLESVQEAAPGLPVILFAADGEVIADEAYAAGATDYVRRTAAIDAEAVLVKRIQNYAVGAAPAQERARFIELFEKFPEPTISYGFEDDRAVFRSVNAAFEETFGFDAETVVGDPVDEHIVPQRKQDQSRNIDHRVQAGELLDEVVRRQTANGDRIFNLRNIPVRSDGNIDGYAVYSDITDQRVRERELERFEVIVETMPIGVLVLDGDGTIVALNDQLTELFDAINRDWQERDFLSQVSAGALPEPISPEYLAAVSQAFEETGEAVTDETVTGRPLYTDELWLELESDRVCYELRISELDVDEGGILEIGIEGGGYVVLVQDVTRRKRREEQLREREARLEEQKADLETQTSKLEYQNERLEEFAGVVSHDLRNPLNLAQGNLELLEAAEDDQTRKDAGRKIGDALDRMEVIIDDALTMAREGRAVTETTPITLPTVVEQSWEIVDTESARLDSPPAVTIEADRGRLLTIFENLFRNAVDHGPEDVTITVGALEDGFYIEDDGPGIPDDLKEDVLEQGMTTTDDGTGFGLSIVRDVVRAHGWTLAVTDGSAGGARFEITDVTFRA